VKIYAVGGAVRDELLGLSVADRDYVVVGSTPEEMTALGYKPVGRDFPVFLHPQTHEQYALARTERKIARGYKGFHVHAAPEVTLEQDLERRDLTINAMARDEAGGLIDPFGGAADLERGLLRHVSLAFVEDPVRILRVARFAARFGFAVLVPERVWQEFSRGLMERDPGRMFPLLADAGFLAKLLPELGLEFEQGTPANDAARVLERALARAAAQELGLAPRFALVVCVGASVETARALSERFKAPGDCRDLALLAARHLDTIERAASLDAAALLALLEGCDAFRRPERFGELLAVAECLEYAKGGRAETPYRSGAILRRALAAADGVDAAKIAAHSASGEIPAELRRARIAAIATSV